MKLLLIKIHKWVGLGLGVLLLMQALTGLTLAHKEAIAAWFGGAGLIDVSQAHQPLDNIIAAVNEELPGYRLERIVYRNNSELPLVVRAIPPDGSKFHVVLVDPTDASVLASGPMWRFPLQLAERVHVSLLSGRVGHRILLLEALGLVFMGISGLIIWWPRKNRIKQALVIHWKGASRRLIRDIHAVPGTLTAILMLLAGLTGAMLVTDDAVVAMVSTVAEVEDEISLELPDVEQPAEVVSWQRAKEQLHEQLPDGRLRQFRFRGFDGRILSAVMVAQNSSNPRAHHIAVMDRWADQVTVVSDGNALPAGSVFIEWILPLHTGEAWGMLRPLMMSILGLSLAGMAVTGFLMWLNKRRSRRRRELASQETATNTSAA